MRRDEGKDESESRRRLQPLFARVGIGSLQPRPSSVNSGDSRTSRLLASCASFAVTTLLSTVPPLCLFILYAPLRIIEVACTGPHVSNGSREAEKSSPLIILQHVRLDLFSTVCFERPNKDPSQGHYDFECVSISSSAMAQRLTMIFTHIVQKL